MNLDRLAALIKQHEGYRDYPYDDKSPWPRSEISKAECELRAGQYKVRATGGTATIGWGETSAEVIDRYWGTRITPEEAEVILRPRIQSFAEGVARCIQRPLTAHQLEACACRAYQTGVGGFCRSKVATRLSAGDIGGALAAWRSDFAHPQRSEAEIAHFLTPDEGVPTVKLVTRAEWGSVPPLNRTPAPNMTLGVGVHWLGPGAGRLSHHHCPAQMREIEAFHMGPERGWVAFGYNAAACSHGYVFEGRGPGLRNAANGGGTRNGVDANAGWASVLYLAGTDGPGLTPAGMDAINDAAQWLGVAAGEWLGHRDFLSTECPGAEIYGWVLNGHPRGSTEPRPPVDPLNLAGRTALIFHGE